MKKQKLLALVLAVTMLVLALAGCAKSASYDMDYNTAAQGSMKTEAIAEAPMAPMTDYEEVAAEEPADAPYDTVTTADAAVSEEQAPQADVSSDFAAKIIYSASLQLQTTEFDKTVQTLDQQVKSFGGFVERSDISGDVTYNSDGTTSVVNRYGYYTLRVPCDRFEEFLSQLGGLGNVIYSSKNAENVTSRYTDYEARLESLRTQEERLLDMLAKSEDVETLIALEQRLADVRYETESIERNLRNLDMQIGYSTVDVTVEEVEIYTPTAPVTRTFSEKLSDAFSDGWRGFTRGLQGFALGLAEAAPALILLAIFVVVAILVVRRIVKKHKANEEAAKVTLHDDEPKQ